MDKEKRKRNIIVFGLEEFANETKWKTGERVMSLLAAKPQINIGMHYIDNLFWVGIKKQNRPILIKFTTCMAKSEIMCNKHRLKGTKLRIENDYHYSVRIKRKALLKHMWEARKVGKSAFLVHDKIKINIFFCLICNILRRIATREY